MNAHPFKWHCDLPQLNDTSMAWKKRHLQGLTFFFLKAVCNFAILLQNCKLPSKKNSYLCELTFKINIFIVIYFVFLERVEDLSFVKEVNTTKGWKIILFSCISTML